MLRTHKKHPVAGVFLCLYSRYGNSKSLGLHCLKGINIFILFGKLGFADMIWLRFSTLTEHRGVYEKTLLECPVEEQKWMRPSYLLKLRKIPSFIFKPSSIYNINGCIEKNFSSIILNYFIKFSFWMYAKFFYFLHPSFFIFRDRNEHIFCYTSNQTIYHIEYWIGLKEIFCIPPVRTLQIPIFQHLQFQLLSLRLSFVPRDFELP